MAVACAEEMSSCNGRWIHTRDDGFKEFMTEVTGGAAAFVISVMEVRPERWYTKHDDGSYSQKIVNMLSGPEGATTRVKYPQNFQIPKPGEEAQPGPDGKTYTGVTKVYHNADGTELYEETELTSTDGTKQHQFYTLKIIDGELHAFIEDKVKGIKCARIFKRYPYYVIDNKTGGPISLTTYKAEDMVCFVPWNKVEEIKEGVTYLDATAADVEEEQAVFQTPDGKKWTNFNIKAFGSYEATPDKFE
jgi:hypothetical protein